MGRKYKVKAGPVSEIHDFRTTRNASLQEFANVAGLSVDEAYPLWHELNAFDAARLQLPCSVPRTNEIPLRERADKGQRVVCGGACLGLTPKDIRDVANEKEIREYESEFLQFSFGGQIVHNESSFWKSYQSANRRAVGQG